MKAPVGAFNQEKALVGALSVIMKTDCETDGSIYSTTPLPLLSATRHGAVFKNSSGFTGNWIILHIYISSHENQYCNISWIFIWQTENISFNSNVLLDIQIFSAKSQVLEMINSYRSLYSLIVSMNSMNCKIMHIGELRRLPLHISLWSWCNEIKISWSVFFSISTSTPCN